MLRRRPTAAELQAAFDQQLRHILAGGGLLSDTGFSSRTNASLKTLMREYPNPSVASLANAKAAIREQLDATGPETGHLN